MNLLDIAKSYDLEGFQITPVKDKRPMKSDWVSIGNEKTLESWPKGANGIGLILGEESDIVCLDIDIKDQGDPVLKGLLELLPQNILSGRTGDKEKPPARFFVFNGEKSRKFININVEILSTGNQVVLPPSHHPKGYNYEWVGESLLDVDKEMLPVLSKEIIDYLEVENEKRKKSKIPSSEKLKKSTGRCAHNSHNQLSKMGVSMFYSGKTKPEIIQELLKWDRRYNKDSDFFYFNCPTRRWKSENLEDNATDFVKEIFENRKNEDADEKFKKHIESGFTKWLDDKKYVRQIPTLFNYFNEKYKVGYSDWDKTFWAWDGMCHVEHHENFALRFAQENYDNPILTQSGEATSFLHYAKRNSKCVSKSDFVLRDSGYINFLNGMYSMNEKILIPHNSNMKMSYIVPHNYVEDIDESDTPVWNQLLDTLMLGRKDLVKSVEEFIGYALSSCSYKEFNKILILDGSGSNGKSTLLRIIGNIIGQKNSSAVGLMDIQKDKFAAFGLVNKLINFCSEEPKECFENTGPVKKLTGGDSMQVEEKHKSSFAYENIAKFIISYNKLPFFPDDSLGMRRRLILVPCEQNFEKNPELKLRNPEKRIIENEIEAVIKKCLKAFQKVRERGAFTVSKEGNERVKEMIVASNPVYTFLKEEIEVTKDERHVVLSNDLYNHFEDFNGRKTRINKINFLKRLSEKLLKVEGVKKIRTLRGRGYSGIRLVN